MSEAEHDLSRVKSIIESLVFLSEEPLPLQQIKKVLQGVPGKQIREAIDELENEYREHERGIFIAEVAGGYQFRTHPANADYVRVLLQQKPQRLSKPAMETLAIVAYRQPIIKPDVDKVRGTDSGGVLQTLLQHRLIKILGRQNAPGKPFIYGTTKEFLEKFGLKDLSGLPTLREIEEISGVPIEQTPIDMLPEEEAGLDTADGETPPESESPEGEQPAGDTDDAPADESAASVETESEPEPPEAEK